MKSTQEWSAGEVMNQGEKKNFFMSGAGHGISHMRRIGATMLRKQARPEDGLSDAGQASTAGKERAQQ